MQQGHHRVTAPAIVAASRGSTAATCTQPASDFMAAPLMGALHEAGASVIWAKRLASEQQRTKKPSFNWLRTREALMVHMEIMLNITLIFLLQMSIILLQNKGLVCI